MRDMYLNRNLNKAHGRLKGTPVFFLLMRQFEVENWKRKKGNPHII
jgi:hypothetical protein